MRTADFCRAIGRVMEMLSEHTLEGWLEGYLLTGRHGFFSSYEAFVHIIDSMFNQHAKWLEKSKLELRWRAPISSLNLLITSLVWRQDHNGFTHQDPGFLDVVTNKSPEVTRIYLPPDANCLLSVTDHCLRSDELRERDCGGQGGASAVPDDGAGDRPLHQGHRDLGLRVERRRRGAGCGDGVRGRYSYGGVAGCGGDSAGAVPGVEDPVYQRGGSVPADAGGGASAWDDRQGVRLRCSRRTSR